MPSGRPSRIRRSSPTSRNGERPAGSPARHKTQRPVREIFRAGFSSSLGRFLQVAGRFIHPGSFRAFVAVLRAFPGPSCPDPRLRSLPSLWALSWPSELQDPEGPPAPPAGDLRPHGGRGEVWASSKVKRENDPAGCLFSGLVSAAAGKGSRKDPRRLSAADPRAPGRRSERRCFSAGSSRSCPLDVPRTSCGHPADIHPAAGLKRSTGGRPAVVLRSSGGRPVVDRRAACRSARSGSSEGLGREKEPRRLGVIPGRGASLSAAFSTRPERGTSCSSCPIP